MGYFLTTSPDGPLVRRLAQPKTHTPFSPVKERGLRFYSPETGRWLSKDRIGEMGGRNVYAFLLNCPADDYDAQGNISETIDGKPDFLSPNRCTGKGGFASPGSGNSHPFTKWVITGTGNAENNGFIVQHVTITTVIENCNGSNRREDTKVEYWEAWHVGHGVVQSWNDPTQPYKYVDNSVDDLWHPDDRAEHCGEKGIVHITYEGAFSSDSVYWPIGPASAPWGGGLMGTATLPTIWGSLKVETTKSVIYFWKCCCCDRERTLLWKVGPNSEDRIDADHSRACCSK